MLCPTHHTPMDSRLTSYGWRFACPEDDCDVVSWGGKTSTPADGETRRLRHDCHLRFDPLWRDVPRRFRSRDDAYRWLGRVLGLAAAQAHIGMLDAAQCRRLLAAVKGLRR